MINRININEVDCDMSNSLKTKYFKNRYVQHQILVNDEPLGKLNGVTDNDRGFRYVLNKSVNNQFVLLFERCKELKNKMMPELYSTKEETEMAKDFNKTIKEEIEILITKMWNIESLDLSYKLFYNILNY